MDLFDENSFFSGQIPMLAASRNIIRAAAYALSAKHISQLVDSQPYQSHCSIARAGIHRSLLDLKHNDLRYRSVHFYDAAIKQIKTAVSRETLEATSDDETLSSEEILAVVAILSMYELMDAPGVEWRAHLGALPLLDETTSATPGPTTSTLPLLKLLARKSLFWIFARQDVMSACKYSPPESKVILTCVSKSCSRNTDIPQSRRRRSMASIRSTN